MRYVLLSIFIFLSEYSSGPQSKVEDLYPALYDHSKAIESVFQLRTAFHNLQRDYEASGGVYVYTFPSCYAKISEMTKKIQRIRKERADAIVAQAAAVQAAQTIPKVQRSTRMKPVCPHSLSQIIPLNLYSQTRPKRIPKIREGTIEAESKAPAEDVAMANGEQVNFRLHTMQALQQLTSALQYLQLDVHVSLVPSLFIISGLIHLIHQGSSSGNIIFTSPLLNVWSAL